MYGKLTGKRRVFFNASQLWMGNDHLLLSLSSAFGEEYRRYMFSDIQAIVVTELESRVAQQAVFAILSLVAFVLAVVVPQAVMAKVLWAIPASGLVIAVIVDIARGRRCRCVLQTAVSEHVLEPVTRMRTANAVLTTMNAVIQSTQGQLTEISSALVASHAVADLPTPEKKPSRALRYSLLAAFVLSAIICLLTVDFNNSQLGTLAWYCALAEATLAIIVFRQRPRSVQRSYFYSALPVILGLIAFELVLLIAYLGYNFTTTVQAKGVMPPASTWPWIRQVTAFEVLWRLAAGIALYIDLGNDNEV